MQEDEEEEEEEEENSVKIQHVLAHSKCISFVKQYHYHQSLDIALKLFENKQVCLENSKHTCMYIYVCVCVMCIFWY